MTHSVSSTRLETGILKLMLYVFLWGETPFSKNLTRSHWSSNWTRRLFERILEIPIMWSKGRSTCKVHLCMSIGESFPNLYIQLDVIGLVFLIIDAPSWFSVRYPFFLL